MAAVISGRRGAWAWLVGLAVVFVATQAIFFAATLAGAAVPNAWVVSALDDDADAGLWDAADFPADGVGERAPGVEFAGYSDSYTECIALTIGLAGQPDATTDFLYRALASPHLGTCSLAYPAVQQLAETGTSTAETFTYSRMWNGATALTRPLIAIEGIGAVRIAAALLMFAGTAAILLGFARRRTTWLGVALVGPILLSTNLLTQPLDSFPHVLSFGVAMFGVAAGVRLGREPIPAILIGAAVAGAVLNYVDYILMPTVAWTMFASAVVAGRVLSAPRERRGALLALFAAAVGWIAGYAATWVARWVIAVAAFGDQALQEILSIVSTRIGGQYGDVVRPGLGRPTWVNARLWWETIPTSHWVAVLAAVLVAVALIVLARRRDGRGLVIALIAALPVLLVPGWYELLSNHSQIHTWFTYRAVPAALGVLVVAAWLPVLAQEPRVHNSRDTPAGENRLEPQQ